jgi:hypothetical protein
LLFLRSPDEVNVSALRLNAPGKPVRLILLGHDEPTPVPLYQAAIKAMRVPFSDRLAGLPARRSA